MPVSTEGVTRGQEKVKAKRGILPLAAWVDQVGGMRHSICTQVRAGPGLMGFPGCCLVPGLSCRSFFRGFSSTHEAMVSPERGAMGPGRL